MCSIIKYFIWKIYWTKSLANFLDKLRVSTGLANLREENQMLIMEILTLTYVNNP